MKKEKKWAGYGSKKDSDSTSFFEIQKYYQNDPRFKGVFSGNNLTKKIKDEAYIINLDEYAHGFVLK